MTKEFFIGLDRLHGYKTNFFNKIVGFSKYYFHRLTNSDYYSLRIQMWDTDSSYAEVSYGKFKLSDKDTYNLEVGDFVEPNAYGLMDDLKESNGAPFSAVNVNNSVSRICDSWFGPWW